MENKILLQLNLKSKSGRNYRYVVSGYGEKRELRVISAYDLQEYYYFVNDTICRNGEKTIFVYDLEDKTLEEMVEILEQYNKDLKHMIDRT